MVLRALCTMLLGLGLGLGLGLAPGAAAADAAAERARIRDERAQAQARFEQARRDCEQRFATTACLDQARAERRGVMERLQREEVLLDTEARRQRAADRMRRIQDKLRAVEAEPAPPVAAAPAASAPRRPVPGPAKARTRPAKAQALATSAPAAARPAAHPRADPAQRAETEADQRAAYDRRQERLKAHQADVARRNAERAGKHPPAAPLPPGQPAP